MAKTRTIAKKSLPAKKGNNPMIGRSPTNAQKLLYIASKLGLDGISEMQGSTVNLFDTVAVPTNAAARQTLSFFLNANGKSQNFSNFQQQKLGAGETLIIERVNFFLLILSGSNLNSDATQIIDVVPLSECTVDQGTFTAPGALKMGTMFVNIANSTVLKKYNVFEQDPSFNPQTTGISISSYPTTAATTGFVTKGPVGYNGLVLEAPPVLPPDQTLEIQLQIPPVGTVAANVAICCVAGRFGSIFSAGTTL